MTLWKEVEFKSLQMEKDMRENGVEVRNKDKDLIIIRMEIDIMEIGIKTRRVAKENIIIIIKNLYMMGNGLMELERARENIFFKMEIFMKESKIKNNIYKI